MPPLKSLIIRKYSNLRHTNLAETWQQTEFQFWGKIWLTIENVHGSWLIHPGHPSIIFMVSTTTQTTRFSHSLIEN